MNLKYIIAKGLKIVFNPPALNNCLIDKTSTVCSRSELNSTEIDRYSYVGNMCFLVNVQIGSFCSIADRCVIGGAAHPMERVSTSPVFHNGKNVMKKNFAEHSALKTPRTVIGNDVWLGMGCYIKAGVSIGNGAVVGMGSVVTKDIPAYEIWAGNPAKKIRDRFDCETSAALEASEWWKMSDGDLAVYSQYFDNPKKFLLSISEDK